MNSASVSHGHWVSSSIHEPPHETHRHQPHSINPKSRTRAADRGRTGVLSSRDSCVLYSIRYLLLSPFANAADGWVRPPKISAAKRPAHPYIHVSSQFTWRQFNNSQIQATVTAFPNFSDKVLLGERDRKKVALCHIHGSASRSPLRLVIYWTERIMRSS